MSHNGNGRDPFEATHKMLRDIRRRMATKEELNAIRDTMATKEELGVVVDRLGTMTATMATKADLDTTHDAVARVMASIVTKIDVVEDRLGKRIDDIRRAIKETHRRHGVRIKALEVHTGLRPR